MEMNSLSCNLFMASTGAKSVYFILHPLKMVIGLRIINMQRSTSSEIRFSVLKIEIYVFDYNFVIQGVY